MNIHEHSCIIMFFEKFMNISWYCHQPLLMKFSWISCSWNNRYEHSWINMFMNTKFMNSILIHQNFMNSSWRALWTVHENLFMNSLQNFWWTEHEPFMHFHERSWTGHESSWLHEQIFAGAVDALPKFSKFHIVLWPLCIQSQLSFSRFKSTIQQQMKWRKHSLDSKKTRTVVVSALMGNF